MCVNENAIDYTFLSLSKQLDFINFIKFCFQVLFLIYAKFVVSKKLKISLSLLTS